MFHGSTSLIRVKVRATTISGLGLLKHSFLFLFSCNHLKRINVI